MIEEKIKELKGQSVLLAFSRGKDAIVTWLYLREKGINVIPVYYSLCPDIEFVDESLSYYEKYFQQKIEVLPSERYADMIQYGVFLTKSRSELADTFEFTGYDKKQLNQYMRKKLSQKDTWQAVGIKRYDSLNRLKSFKNHFGVDYKIKTFYPIIHFTDKDIVEYLHKYDVRLPIDYKIWGSSWDGYTGRWLSRFKKFLPNDFENLKKTFPLIEVELKRWEIIKLELPDYERYFNQKVKKFSVFCD